MHIVRDKSVRRLGERLDQLRMTTIFSLQYKNADQMGQGQKRVQLDRLLPVAAALDEHLTPTELHTVDIIGLPCRIAQKKSVLCRRIKIDSRQQ